MQVTTVGLDLAKSVFQVHAVDTDGRVIVRKALRRAQMMPFFAKLAPCLVGMEACGTSHHCARELTKLGHEVRVVTVAAANRTARVAWSIMARGGVYRAPDQCAA